MDVRIETKKLEEAAKVAEKKVDEAITALDRYLDLLTPEERSRIVKAPAAFQAAGRTLARVAIDHPVIAQSTGYDPKAVLEDLDNAQVLAPVAEKVERLSQLIADARLSWTAEAYVPSLQVYGVAKVIARHNANVQVLVEPLGDVFALGRERKKTK